MAQPSDTISFAFNRMKVPYNFLEALLPEKIYDKNINFFLDMKYVMGILRIPEYTEALDKDGFFTDSKRVIAEILNIVAHYRQFLVSSRVSKITFYLMFDKCIGDDIRKSISQAFAAKQYEKYHKPAYIGFVGSRFDSFKCLIPDFRILHSKNYDLSCIPSIVQNLIAKESSENIFLTEDPLIHFYSTIFHNFYVLRSHSEHSRLIKKDGFFPYLSQKYKWAESSNLNDDWIPLFMNLTGGSGVIDAFRNFKNKKAVNFISALVAKHSLSAYSTDVYSLPEFTAEESEFLFNREKLFNPLTHVLSVDESVINDLRTAVTERLTPSRSEFNKLNVENLGNLVDEERLFLTIR